MSKGDEPLFLELLTKQIIEKMGKINIKPLA